jgi:hypothetical protein
VSLHRQKICDSSMVSSMLSLYRTLINTRCHIICINNSQMCGSSMAA